MNIFIMRGGYTRVFFMRAWISKFQNQEGKLQIVVLYTRGQCVRVTCDMLRTV